MSKRNLIVILIIAAALIILGIGIKTRKPAEKVVKIGAILPLTGPVSFLGEGERNVLDYFENKINSENHRIKFQFVYEDSKGDPKTGVSAYHKLRLEGVKYFIISLTRVAEAIQPIADKDSAINFVLSIHPYIAKKSPWTFRVYFGAEEEVDGWLKLLKYFNAKKVVSLYVKDASLDVAIGKILKDSLENRGIELLSSETYNFNEPQKIKGLITKIKSLNPDIIVTEDFGNIYPVIFKEAISANLKQKIIGGIGMFYIPPNSISLAEGIPFVGPKLSIEPTDQYKEFKDKFRTKYNLSVGFDGLYTYYSAKVLTDAILQTKHYTNQSEVRDNIISIKKFNALGQDIIILPDGTGKTGYGIGVYRHGKIEKFPIQ